MEKIISIVIPTYNMEKYLHRCLDSVLDHKWDDELEAIVVNDGSTDSSLQIALEYKEKFPEIVVVIDKDNGHYGSTINASLPIAKGKYIKILDADDWYDTKEFSYFIEKLKDTDSDLLVTNYTYNYISKKKKKRTFPSSECRKNYDFSVILSHKKLSTLPMHAMSYKTELLRQIGYKQTEGLPHTDMEWLFYPLFFIQTIAFIHANVYQYFIGREGQSVDRHVRFKNLSLYSQVISNLFSYYSNFSARKMDEYRKEYLWNIVLGGYRCLYRSYLLEEQPYKFNQIEMKEFDKSVKEKGAFLYSETAHITIHRLIPIPYVRYWRRYSKRLPQWIIDIYLFARKYSKLMP
jgi:glycosyltransferase involved in cell wall biosynthesis